MSLEYLESNRWLKIDYLFGLRAWGPVLYGILPASLAALGVLKAPDLAERFGDVFGPFIILAVVPIVALYLLVRQRLRAWYLLDRMLWIRTSAVVFSTLALCSAISWAGGRGATDAVSSPWWTQSFEAVLLGLAVLVVPSALFMTVIKESGGPPGLPSKDFVTNLGALRNSLAVIWRDDIWRQEVSASATFQNDLLVAQANAGRLSLVSPKGSAQQRFFDDLSQDLTRVEDA